MARVWKVLALLPLCHALRPDMSEIINETKGVCAGRTQVVAGECHPGGINIYDCCRFLTKKKSKDGTEMLVKTPIPFDDCSNYFTYFKPLDRYVSCQAFEEFQRHGRRHVKICAIRAQNPINEKKPRPPAVLCDPNDDVVHDLLTNMLQKSRAKCKEYMCNAAKTGSWSTFNKKKAIDKPWPKVAGMSESGWQTTVKKHCTTEHGGVKLIDVEKLYDNLLTTDAAGEQIFNKEAC
eukprot:symbB.v1.2.013744.t1/scaffold978.1/size277179/5